MDLFGIITLIVLLLVLIYLAVSVFYYYNMTQLAHPSTVETTMLLWMGVALVISVLALVIYAVVHVFRHEEQLMKQLQGVGDASPFPTLFSGPRM